MIIGGSNNTISAQNSLAAGQAININKEGTFAWSDYDENEYFGDLLTPSQANTFLIRSLNGMGINVE